MRVAIVALGSAGDVHPFLGIGQALRARGHAVTVHANPVFMPLIERSGLAFRPVGSAAAYRSAMADPALWDPRTSLKTLWRAVAPDIRPLFDSLAASIDDRTVMLGSLWAFAARLVQEKFEVPYLGAQVSPSTLLSATLPPVHPRFQLPASWPVAGKRMAIHLIERWVIDRTLGPELNRLRRDLGLAPVTRVLGRWMHSPQGVLGLFPDWFAPRQPDWPSPYTACGFPLHDAGEGETLDAELREFLDRGRPPVIVTPGSGAVHGPQFLRSALDALQRTGERGVLLGADAARLTDLPATVRTRAYLPLSQLLPFSRAIWHHGGIGTSAVALAAGKPQLVTPVAHDQFDNAARLHRLGVALPAGPAEPIDGRLRRLLQSESVYESCRVTRRRVDPADTARSRVVRSLERLQRPSASLHSQAATAHVLP